MKILLIGAGAVGSVISQYLSKYNEVSEIVCASKDIQRAKEFITEGDKTKLVELDASSIDKIVDKARGVNLIINASLPRFNENDFVQILRQTDCVIIKIIIKVVSFS